MQKNKNIFCIKIENDMDACAALSTPATAPAIRQYRTIWLKKKAWDRGTDGRCARLGRDGTSGPGRKGKIGEELGRALSATGTSTGREAIVMHKGDHARW